MIVRRVIFLLVFVLTAACAGATPPQANPGPTSNVVVAGAATSAAENGPAPVSSPVRAIAIPEPPARDLLDLTRRVRGVSASPTVTPRPEPAVGDRYRFWLTNLQTYVNYQSDATLALLTPEAAYWVEDGVNLSQDDLSVAASAFEAKVLPTVRRYFGNFWSPGIDGDPRLHVLHARLNGVGGYYSVADEYPVAVNPYSNEREMIYINTAVLRPGSDAYLAVLAHELEHAVHWNLHRGEEAWINEGSAELASRLSGFRPNFPRIFERTPNTQLNEWPDQLGETAPHYGASYLFLSFLFANYGGRDSIPLLLRQTDDGLEAIDGYLRAIGSTTTTEDVFRTWTIANVSGRTAPPYAYDVDRPSVQSDRTLLGATEVSTNVHQFAARYFSLPTTTSGYSLTFAGSRSVPLVPTTARSGRFLWWSNSGDSIDSRLTRAVDLTGVHTATLRFSTWFDIEQDWDYGYVMVSTDGGQNWKTLRGGHTTAENPHGNSLGQAYTGKSGGGSTPEWVDETVDLTEFGGQRVLLRFEYVTDEGANNDGVAIDDVSIPEIGYSDDGEAESDWSAEGFYRTDNALPQVYFVQAVDLTDPPTVYQMPIAEDGTGRLMLPPTQRGVDRVLIVSAATRWTYASAPFRVALQ